MTLRPLALPTQVTPTVVSTTGDPIDRVADAEVLAVPLLPAEAGGALVLGPGAAAVGDALGVDLLAVAEAARATGAVGDLVTLPVPAGTPAAPDLRSVLLVGVGTTAPTDLRRAAAVVARAARGRSVLATTLAGLDAEQGIEAVTAGLVLGGFVFSWRSTPPEHPPCARAVLAGPGGGPGGGPGAEQIGADAVRLARASAVAGAGWRARMLATVPSNLKNPAWLAEQAEQLAAEAGLEVRVWDDERLRAEGFGGIVGVGQGSATPPRLIRLDYAPRKASRRTPTVVLVGKGITFDSGGLSIKPAQAMVTMKRDMTGGAVVMSTMAGLAAVDCPVRVVGLVAAAENAVSGTASRPGDVLRHWGGRTTEVTNTDAEGRLVMADALAYAVAEVEPAAIVDVATLTGAARVALGQQVSALFGSDDALAEAVRAAGERAGEPFWRLPLHEAYRDKLTSKVADADNAPSGPGAIMAALFLQAFVGDVPWVHLDVAGDAGTDRYEWTDGPSGFGARALLTWLGGEQPLAGVGG